MATDHFCLIWNNFQNSILSALGNLQTCQDLVDVTLMCEGKNVKAHKVILSACSPYFRNLFKETPCQHPIIILKDVTHGDLTALLQFMYQGEVMVSQDSLASFLKTAELLQISGLAGSSQAAANLENSEPAPRAPPEINLGKPPDSPETVASKISSDISFKKQKRDRIEPEITENTSSSFNLQLDPEQSCSYQASSPIIVKTESLDRDYDDMDTEPTDISNPDHKFDSTCSQLEEPSILERSLKAQSDWASYIPESVEDTGETQLGDLVRRTPRVCRQDPPIRLSGDMTKHRLEAIVSTGKRKYPCRKCRVCMSHKLRGETRYICKFCVVPLHKGECFERYHTMEDY